MMTETTGLVLYTALCE